METETCSLSSSDIARFRSYGVPDDAQVAKPSSNQTVLDAPHGMVAVYLEFFDDCGLRFPLTPFFCRCLLYYELSITQLTPNFVRTLVGFEVLCRIADVEPSVALFRYFFCPIKSLSDWYGLLRLPNPTKWIFSLTESSARNTKFVFVGKELFPKEMSWKKQINDFPKPCLKGSMLDDMRKLSGFGVDWSVLLSEKMLHSAKMPNVYAAAPLPVKLGFENGNETPKSGKSRKTGAAPSKRAKLSVNALRNAISTNDDVDGDDDVTEAGVGGTSAELNASLPRPKLDTRIAVVEAAFEAILEEVKCGYKDSDHKLVAACDLAETYQKELSAEVEKNQVLQEALEKAKTELVAESNLAETYQKKLSAEVKKNQVLQEALEKANTEGKNLAENYQQALQQNMILEEARDIAHKEALKKNLALEKALEKAISGASHYSQRLDAEVKKKVALGEALEKAIRDLHAEKMRSAAEERKRAAVAQKEVKEQRDQAEKAMQRAEVAEQEAGALRSQVDAFRKAFQTVCSKALMSPEHSLRLAQSISNETLADEAVRRTS